MSTDRKIRRHFQPSRGVRLTDGTVVTVIDVTDTELTVAHPELGVLTIPVPTTPNRVIR